MNPTRGRLCGLALPALLLAPGCAARADRPEPAEPVTAVLGAMAVEVERLGQELTDKEERTVQGVRFTTGRLAGKRVVLAHSGMGKVNAAMAAALLAEGFRPARVLFTGIAGGLNPDLRPGDVVIGSKAAFHDYGEWTPDGFRVGRTVDPFTGKPNPLFFPADAGLLAAAEAAPAAPARPGPSSRPRA